MLKSVFVCGLLGVLLIPAKCKNISVCIEDDKDLRVDCLFEPEPNRINTFQFSWSSSSIETVINTNVSKTMPDTKFKGKSTVQELKPHGYRMTVPNFKDELPHNCTFLCRVSSKTDRVMVEKDKIPTCSAVSVFLRTSISWVVCLLLFFYQTQS